MQHPFMRAIFKVETIGVVVVEVGGDGICDVYIGALSAGREGKGGVNHGRAPVIRGPKMVIFGDAWGTSFSPLKLPLPLGNGQRLHI